MLTPRHPRRCNHALIASSKPALNKQGEEHHPVWLLGWLEHCRFLRHSLIANHKAESITEPILQAVPVGGALQTKLRNNVCQLPFVNPSSPSRTQTQISVIFRSWIQKSSMHVQRPCQAWDQIDRETWLLSKIPSKAGAKVWKIFICGLYYSNGLPVARTWETRFFFFLVFFFGMVTKNVFRQVDSICTVTDFFCVSQWKFAIKRACYFWSSLS